MKHSLLLAIVLILISTVVSEDVDKPKKRGPTITSKVYFDIEIDGEPAGRITMGLYE